MSEWTIDTLKEHFENLLKERDKALEVAQEKVNELEGKIENIKADHVTRSDFNDLKDGQSQGKGMRIAAGIALGIIITLISVALGAMYANQLTNNDVSNQIGREAPWLEDKPVVDARLNKLETKIVLLQTGLATHEVTDNLRAKLKK